MNEIKLDTLPASGCDDSSNNDVYDQACNDDFSEETTDMTTNDKKVNLSKLASNVSFCRST